MRLCRPDAGEPYYQGTRFDRSGVFRSVDYHGRNYVDEWFPDYSPVSHDAVCGPSEEFSQCGFDRAAPGGTFMKAGVGMLYRPDDAPYDRFRLYEVADPGIWKVSSGKDRARFVHTLKAEPWGYEYEKRVGITGEGRLEIIHSLTCTGTEPIEGEVYNHNFLTMGNLSVGPWRKIRFPFVPNGDWRPDSVGALLAEDGIGFERQLVKGEKAYIGNLVPEKPFRGLAFSVEDTVTGLRVEVDSEEDFSHAVFWSNHMVACVEPYMPLQVSPGETRRWRIGYSFLN